ncbi:glycosyltransferase family 4 protein [Nesterenkonia lutea]|uniref:Glycosyltransferase involved in cell wall biosynthesis n=1 Tax=Nesterenkonia lutea TaxID=272919 RepID=A0ABR9JDY2_9MICC|nr:glycosyltransferase family 4 protein [Nesterenkonia lutea]MBE1524140.1 glycosyltransferase involved in cell wall biosynthesis [Nesterenkonia lutea]
MTNAAAHLPTVLHIGPQGSIAGGMAQVVNAYLSWTYSRVQLRGSRSTKGKGDRLALFRSAGSVVRITALRIAGGRSVAAVHLSQGGSFLREGTLVRLAQAMGLGVAVHLHGSGFADFARRNPTTVRRVLASADVVLVLTQESETLCRELLPGSRVVRIPNAVTVPAGLLPKKKVIVFGGAVGHRKGVDVLLEAWGALPELHDTWKLIIAGPPDGIHIDASVPSCSPLGSIPHAGLMSLLDEASIAVLPSRGEAMPMFVLEAMARRCAVVATDVGQVREVVEGAGLITPPGDVDALVRALRELAQSDERRAQLADAARDRVERRHDRKILVPVLEDNWLSTLEMASEA